MGYSVSYFVKMTNGIMIIIACIHSYVHFALHLLNIWILHVKEFDLYFDIILVNFAFSVINFTMSEQKAAKLQQQYNQFQENISELESQVIGLEQKIEEHKIVKNTLNNIPQDKRQGRKCYKMVGGVLVDKSIDNVLLILNEEFDVMVEEHKLAAGKLLKIRKERETWMTSNNVKIMRQ